MTRAPAPNCVVFSILTNAGSAVFTSILLGFGTLTVRPTDAAVVLVVGFGACAVVALVRLDGLAGAGLAAAATGAAAGLACSRCLLRGVA